VGRIAAAFWGSARAVDVVLGFAADHGLAMPGAKCTLYDPGLEVTLLLAGAGVPAGQRRSGLVSGVDVGPTLWARAGVDPPSGVDGRDLLSGGAPRERVFAEKTFHSYYDPMRAVRSPAAKLIVNFGVGFRVEVPGDVTVGAIFRSDPGRYTGGPHPVAELYDLRADPLERHNLLEGDAWPAPFEELRTALLAWMRDGDDPLLGARGPLIAPQHRRALHLLGA
jgi:arylsulfatase A-like enzyme